MYICIHIYTHTHIYIFIYSGRNQEAIEDFTKAIAMDKSNASSYNSRGLVYVIYKLIYMHRYHAVNAYIHTYRQTDRHTHIHAYIHTDM